MTEKSSIPSIPSIPSSRKSTCQNCKFFWVQYDYDGCPFFRCTANPPPVYDDKNGWMRPVVYPEDNACRLFQPEEEKNEVKP